MKRSIGNKTFAIQTEWIRITQNPYAPEYPRSGDFVTLAGHSIVPDGRYLVKMVEEFESSRTEGKDEGELDIRISLTNGTRSWRDLNGMNIRVVVQRQQNEVEG